MDKYEFSNLISRSRGSLFIIIYSIGLIEFVFVLDTGVPSRSDWFEPCGLPELPMSTKETEFYEVSIGKYVPSQTIESVRLGLDRSFS